MEPSNQEEEHKHGALDSLRDATPQVMKDNAPRIVAGMKILSSLSMLLSENKMMKLAGAGFSVGNGLAAIYGGKKTEEEKARLREEIAKERGDNPPDGAGDYIYKLTHPKYYPLESSSGVRTLASASWMASSLGGEGGFSPARLISGGLSLASDANIAFGKECVGSTHANPHAQGTVSHYITELKNRPVLLSSLLNMGCDGVSALGGGYEYFVKKKEPNLMLSGLLLGAANGYQAIFVNKSDYNIDAKETHKEETPTSTLCANQGGIDSQRIAPPQLQRA